MKVKQYKNINPFSGIGRRDNLLDDFIDDSSNYCPIRTHWQTRDLVLKRFYCSLARFGHSLQRLVGKSGGRSKMTMGWEVTVKASLIERIIFHLKRRLELKNTVQDYGRMGCSRGKPAARSCMHRSCSDFCTDKLLGEKRFAYSALASPQSAR
jgi:hypothetical protein